MLLTSMGSPFFRSRYTETGRKVFASAAPTLKHLTLELGRSDPGIVLPDVDPQAIAETLFGSMFALSGQGCVTLKRHFVHESIYQGCFAKWLSPPAMVQALSQASRRVWE
jgi:acyl-CoA reductase-like NAD-dependent aldehyde dehydrogenase